jgi:cell fate (sporulation/competence/biofilm development) regulator YlbF (YheA/YmcA/DUF963 family)
MKLFTSQEEIEKEMVFGKRKNYDDLEPYQTPKRKLNLEGVLKKYEARNNKMRQV